MPRLNIFENYPVIHDVTNRIVAAIGSVQYNMVLIPGSISFNTVAMILSGVNTGLTNSFTLQFGLYSLNGATLSLANSASFSASHSTSFNSWVTFGTSATQDITPGNWYFAFVQSQGGGLGAGLSYIANRGILNFGDDIYGGPFFRGRYSVATVTMLDSIATSDLLKDGNGSDNIATFQPYILIAA